jgi:hypothetical protein
MNQAAGEVQEKARQPENQKYRNNRTKHWTTLSAVIKMATGVVDPLYHWTTALNDPDQDHDDCNHHQNVDEPTERVRTY